MLSLLGEAPGLRGLALQKNHPAIINRSRRGKNNLGGIALMKILQ
ncbi:MULTISPECIES: hypothetical protein [unclassified Pseudomonas]|nr:MULTISPECIES: hypothetical protein [unclassified Pseudomonas]